MTEYIFRIADSYTPRDMPMARLAEYMAEYAKLLGEPGNVHFLTLVDASVGLAATVDHVAAPKVDERVLAAGRGGGPEDALRAIIRLDEMLAADNAVGELLRDGAKIIPFQGRNRPRPITYGPITQEGSVEGEIVRIGGTDDTIHVTLRDAAVIYSGCVTNKAVARRMAQHILGPIVRAHGVGKWVRHPDGAWELKSFRIRDFDVLEETSLTEAVAKLRAVAGNEWANVRSPVATILHERGSSETEAGA